MKNVMYIEAGNILKENIISLEETEKSCAKSIEFDSGNSRFYIKTKRHKLYNPNNDPYPREDSSWEKVEQEVYDLYCKFIRTGQNQYLTQAERIR